MQLKIFFIGFHSDFVTSFQGLFFVFLIFTAYFFSSSQISLLVYLTLVLTVRVHAANHDQLCFSYVFQCQFSK